MDKLQQKAKRGIKVAIWAVVLFVSAFVSIFTGAFLDDGPYEKWCPVCLIMFFVLMIGCLVVLITGFSDVMAYDMIRLENKYKNKEMAKIPHCDKSIFITTIEKHGFKKIDANSQSTNCYWQKKKFHFLKDTIRYYVFETKTEGQTPRQITEEMFSNMVERQLNLFLETNYNDKRSVVYILFEFPKINNEELKNIKKACESLLSTETILMGAGDAVEGGLVPVIIDKKSEKIYFFNEPNGLMYYAYGCRMLEKIFL